ncbi:TIGR04283 family arsenosugar biosynthesis glycosyltransferase [Robiginitalea sp. IMCC43444]|uniref:TIGR04283 family arsenosugar biosynthesis glycosyltransferase n=1 Tax=Robiginitalea sp. IMCC43444 TaxID=3459121 RepID=UPI0040437261
MKEISIIIPVLNEAKNLEKLLPYLQQNSCPSNILEILVVDGGSSDGSSSIGKLHSARVINSSKGRAVQLNAGARQACGNILYFLHADSLPPRGFDQMILQAMNKQATAGCFRLQFDEDSWFLRFFAWWTRFNFAICRGGDQSLFLPKYWFDELGGFNEAYRVFEDNEFIQRIYKRFPFTILRQRVLTSARKYRQIGMFRLQYYFGIIHLKYYLGARPEQLHEYYSRKIAGRVNATQNPEASLR